MKIVRVHRLIIMACFLAGLSSTGCTIGSGTWPVSHSNFAYPNSNIVPLGHVKGEASQFYLLHSIVVDPALHEKAVQEAIKQKGGDILVDYYVRYHVKQYLPMFLLTESTWIVEGTAAKMEIGKQTLQ
jgi:hypothetical protein